jgi:hypothetical protein
MRPLRVRFTLRSMMVAMAVLTLICSIAERRLRFQRLAEYHLARSSADIVCCVVLLTDDGKQTSLVKGGTGAPTTLARAAGTGRSTRSPREPPASPGRSWRPIRQGRNESLRAHPVISMLARTAGACDDARTKHG